MEDPAKVIVAVTALASVAYSVSAIARATVAHKREEVRQADAAPALTEARLARIEQAVDAIALEVERISEGQRFTTKLLSDHGQMLPNANPRQSVSNTPT
ncbi:MAG TPA: hypothetical protein VN927_03365 [Gemmatimonadaceae bacterium]|jgi:hypothetical protein|nr:hypothetical protein [Gemmatimonadaceae bacterium]